MTAHYFSEKSFTVDWLTHNLREWENVLTPLKDAPARVLEIGSFEGRSAVFFLEFLAQSAVTCIDTFEGGEEHRVPGRPFGAMSDVEARFDANIAHYGDRVRKLKGHSHDVLSRLVSEAARFDVIYVDGDHHAASALLDARLAWKLLEPGGIMILDDYGWKPELPDSQRPRLGIDEFLFSIAGEFDVAHQGYQVIVKKRAIRSRPKVVPQVTPQVPSQEVPKLTLGGRPVDALSFGALSPPLLSFVLINWNYRDFVGQAIDSIRQQDYPHFECLLIDNGSMDDSVEVMRSHIDGDSRFRIHQFDRNMGQLGAAIWALDEIKGQFVTFVDADDVLMPAFASTHLQVHLALPRSVSLTSSTVVEINTAGDIISSHYGHIDPNHPRAQKGLRKPSQVVRFPEISDQKYEMIAGLVGTIPRWVTGWHWGPGTANMFRRSILDLVRIGDGKEPIMRAADSHFNQICHALTGSAVIDMPLSGYRIHGGNYFARLENIEGLSKGSKEHMAKFHKERIETSELLLANAERFSWLLGGEYWNVLDYSIGSAGGISLRRYGSREVYQTFIRHAEELRRVQGDRKFCNEIGKRFRYRRARKILKKGFGGTLTLRRGAMLMLSSLDRNFSAVRRGLKKSKRRR